MAVDRSRAGLIVLRIALGVFFLFEGIGKIRWFTDPSILASQLNGWAQSVPPGSLSGRYLSTIALPWAGYLARLVPLGELSCGTALIIGFWTPLFAFIAFCMALNFQYASAALFKYSFLTSGYGLPVLGGTLALALSGRGGPSRPRVRPSTRQTSGERD
jgi:uncharacterized membrane protein YphA (DoxX/SURF4 family)